MSASTVRKDLTALGTLFRMAKRWGVLESNPALDVEKPEEPEPHGRALTVDEWGKLQELLPPTLRSVSLFALLHAI